MSEAVDHYTIGARALLENPQDVSAIIGQFSLLSTADNCVYCKEYLPLAARAYALEPNNPLVMYNYASGLSRVGRYSEAVKLYQSCIATGVEEWGAKSWHLLGVTYRAMGNCATALECYKISLSIKNDLLCRKDYALSLMASGKLQEGLEEFEVRHELADARLASGENKQPVARQRLPKDVRHWRGEREEGKTFVVYHEEGLGDFIHFARFIPTLRQLRGSRILLTGPNPDLLEMVADSIPVEGIVPLGAPVKCDYAVGSMSIPHRFGVHYNQISGKPYLRAEPADFPKRGLVNIGLVWRGNSTYGMDAHRSMPFSELCPLFDMPEVAFYSLQVGPAAKEVTRLGLDGFVADLGQFAKNWRATARMIANLDLVITVDTAVGHLAGALGVPVIIMVTVATDWRWPYNNERTPWYDSATIIRQEEQDNWHTVIERVKRKLQGIVHRKQAKTAQPPASNLVQLRQG